MSRRLAAIMFTDLVGFTKLGQQDEEAALRLRHEHQELLRPLFGRYGGREVKSLGDGFLVEFASAVESVRCAVEIQRALLARNAAAAAPGRIDLRIGIHLGDVVDDGGDVVGDAVNVASRIEPLAEPGGIYVSAAVHDQVRNKLPFVLESVGRRPLKNVREPVELFRVVLGGAPTATPRAPAEPDPYPRLAVLPLANLSADASDEYFADGLTDELISRTAQMPQLRVIARTSVQRYKGSPKSIREVGQELDVAVALEGSVRKAGNRVRITVQLVDTKSEAHLWSMRYDRPFDDIFGIQDDIAGQVATSIATHVARPALGPAPPPAHHVPETTDMEAYARFLKARQLNGARGSLESLREALALFEEAAARDPKFARAKVGIAETTLFLATEGVIPYHEAERRAYRELRAALALNEALAEAHSALAGLLLGLDQRELSARSARRAIELNPSLSDPYRWLAQLTAGDGNIAEAVRLLEAARRLNPDDLNVLAFLSRALAYAGRDADALALWASSLPRLRYRVNAHMTEYYLGKGDVARASETLRELEQVRPESGWTEAYRGLVAAARGDRAGAEEAIRRLEERHRRGEMTVLFVGFIQHALGDMDGFVASMDEAQRHHSLPLLELLYSPLYAQGRRDPRLQAILRRQAEERGAPLERLEAPDDPSGSPEPPAPK